MSGFADKHRQKESETKEAVENKAKEYEKLTKEVENFKKSNENLESEIAELKVTIGSLTEALKGITPAKIEEVQESGKHIFDPIKQTAIELNKKIKAAGDEASYRVRNAGEKSWQEYLLQGAFTAVCYVVITAAVMWWGMGIGKIKTNVNYVVDRVNVIHYNQTTGREYGTYDLWHMKEFYDKFNELEKQREETRQQNSN